MKTHTALITRSFIVPLTLALLLTSACSNDDRTGDSCDSSNDTDCLCRIRATLDTTRDCSNGTTSEGDACFCVIDENNTFDPEPNPEPIPNPEPSPLPDVQPEPNPEPTPTPNPLELCQQSCAAVASCNVFTDLCGDTVTTRFEAECRDACREPDFQAEMARIEPEDCDGATQRGMEAFDLRDECGDADGDLRGEGEDNCPTVANAEQDDSDLDGVGDACDLDPSNANVCSDIDEDSCDDCASGAFDPSTDGSRCGIFPDLSIVRDFAGSGTLGIGGDGGQATAAELSQPYALAAAPNGDVCWADILRVDQDNQNRIRCVDAQTGIVTTIAGIGTRGAAGDGGLATEAQINTVSMTFDPEGNLYLSEGSEHRVRRIDAETGIITTIAGNGQLGSTGDDGPATEARLNEPYSVALDSAGHVYIAELVGKRVRRVDAETGIITTIAGNGGFESTGDNGPALFAQIGNPVSIAIDDEDNLLILTYHQVRRVDLRTGIITTAFADIYGQMMVLANHGALYLAGNVAHGITRLDLETNEVTPLAAPNRPFDGHCDATGNLIQDTGFVGTYGLTSDREGNLYVGDINCNIIRRIDVACVLGDADLDGICDAGE